MHQAKDKNDWLHTAHILLAIYSGQPRENPIKWEDVYPFANESKRNASADLEGARTVWTRGIGVRSG